MYTDWNSKEDLAQSTVEKWMNSRT